MSAQRSSDLALFGAFALAHFLVLTSRLIYPDFILNYPFLIGDSNDWIANGLFLAGSDVTYTARPPLLPLALALLHQVSLLDFYPVFIQFLVHTTLVGLYALLRHDYPKLIAGAVSAAWLLNTTWLKLSLPLGADVPAACLLFWAVFFWRRSNYARAGLLAGLSAITQQLALVVAAPMVLTLICFRRQDLKSPHLWLGGVLFAAPTAGWMLYKKLAVGKLGDVILRHWSLLTPHFDSIGYYTYAFAAFVGPPALIGMVLGAISYARRARRDAWCFFLLSALATIFGFFVLLYNFNTLRFLAYVFPLSAVLLAEGLHRLPWPRLRNIVLVLLLAWAVLPSPEPRADPTRIALWPVPPTYLKTTATHVGAGSSTINPLDVEIEIRPSTDLLRYSPYRLVAERYRQPSGQRGLTAHAVSSDLWAIYFYDDASQAGTGYGFATRLGNLLHKKVRYLPSSAFDAVWERLTLERLGELDGQAVFRAGIPGRPGSWAVLARARGLAEAKMLSVETAPRSSEADLALAERATPYLAGRSVAILAPATGLAPWQTYLPFLAPTSQFLVTEPQRERGTRAMLGEGRLIVQLDGFVLNEHQVFGRPWVVIERELHDVPPLRPARW